MSDRYKGAILSPTAPTVTPQSAGGVYTLSQQTQYQGQGVWPSAFNNPINNSLRFRSSASAYLNRTPASAGNRRTWTWSGWVKRGALGGDNSLFTVYGNGTQSGGIYFSNDTVTDALEVRFSFSGGWTGFLVTTQVFRDPSAWYHIVFAADTTQATSTERLKLYVNGVQVTSFQSSAYPSQNTDGFFNQAQAHEIGRLVTNNGYLYDGYMTEINFIDGLALTPSSFGTTDAYGIWQPIPYTGTYGTNGFYLPFTDNSALTTSSNVGLGKDFSGNANYWVTNNISITAGSTYDSMIDVPTNTNQNTANYATLNPLMFRLSNTPGATLSNGNLTSTHTPSAYGSYVFSTIAGIGNKFYYEVTITSLVGGGDVGINDGQAQYSLFTGGVTYLNTGNKIVNGSSTAYGSSWTTGDVIGVALDLVNGTITFYKNNVSQGAASSSIGTSAYFAFGQGDTGSVYNWNFGQRPFVYTPPTGFYPLNTYNLPTPTILAGDDYFNAVLWTGNGSTPRAFTGIGFAPDFAWIKNRTSPANHALIDIVRGTGAKVLESDLTDAENDYGLTVDSFNSDGYTLSQGSLNFSYANTNSHNYVSWNWKANGAGVSNTQGTITSTVSANTTAGFSIVTFTTVTSGTSSVGHGLGVTPSFVIFKARGSTSNWICQHTSTGTQYLLLNGTGAATTDSIVWNSAPTSSVVNMGTGFAGYSGATAVMYCFTAVSGYSAFGSYTGNGSTDGPFVFTGFRPRFVMFKRTDAVEQWAIRDTARDTYNASELELFPNLSNAEEDNNLGIDLISNGFKIRNSANRYNASSGTYIYMAFAENPFKIARGR
jgi:hypothetical protein